MSVRAIRSIAWLVLAIAPLATAGCQLVGAMAAQYERTGSHKVEAAYDGLAGASFAVLASTGRVIESEHPGLGEQIITRLTQRLEERARASGRVPADQIVRYSYRHPSWAARPAQELMGDLGGVDRLIVVDITEYRLHEPGNSWEWSGSATGSVSVFDRASPVPESPVFERLVNVRFPVQTGMGPDQMAQSVVTSELLRRFVERSAWLFYEHEEPNVIEY